jgi:hypothetical protein
VSNHPSLLQFTKPIGQWSNLSNAGQLMTRKYSSLTRLPVAEYVAFFTAVSSGRTQVSLFFITSDKARIEFSCWGNTGDRILIEVYLCQNQNQNQNQNHPYHSPKLAVRTQKESLFVRSGAAFLWGSFGDKKVVVICLFISDEQDHGNRRDT